MSGVSNLTLLSDATLTVPTLAKLGQLEVRSNAYVSLLRVTNASVFDGFATNNNKVWLNDEIRHVLPATVARFGDLRATTVTVSNTFALFATNLIVGGTNLIADGNVRSYWTNAIRQSGVTNLIVTNILDGQTLIIDLFVTNGTTVQLCTTAEVQIPDAWYHDGVAIAINTNGFSRVFISRYGGWTNVTVWTPSFAFVPGPAQTDTTNFATRQITRLLSAVLTNIVASGHGSPYIAFNTNSGTLFNATNLILRSASTVLSNDSGGIASIHVNRSGLYRTIYIDAAAMISNTTAGATFSTEETATPTNHMIDSYVFSGTASNIVQFKLAMPLEWDLGTVRVKLWTTSTNNIAATTNVWGISAAAAKTTTVVSNLTWGTELEITNVVSSAAGQALLTPATPALTIGNSPAAAGNLVWFYVMRKPLDADDNDGGQQKLLGAWLQYREKEAEVSPW